MERLTELMPLLAAETGVSYNTQGALSVNATNITTSTEYSNI